VETAPVRAWTPEPVDSRWGALPPPQPIKVIANPKVAALSILVFI
jgi:hypothetical protein